MLRFSEVHGFRGLEADLNGSGEYPMVGFGASGIEPSGSTTNELLRLIVK
jgi:hypothetical protein